MDNSKATILVVDDEDNIRQLLRKTLEEAGYKVVTASNGQEALDNISSGDVSLVLLDIIMPVMDGFQALEFIREKSNIPVIMVSGLGDVNPLNTSLSLGADDYIKKPFHSRELLARINAKLRRIKN
jgi:DNA-binding response OmpR family regulator